MFRPFCATILCFFLGVAHTHAFSPEKTAPLSPAPLPDFWLKTDQGTQIRFSSLLLALPSDHTTYLHLWTPSCPTCVKEIRMLDKQAVALRERKISVLSVVQDARGMEISPAFRRRHALTTPFPIDTERHLLRLTGIKALPATCRINVASRQVTNCLEGTRDWENF